MSATRVLLLILVLAESTITRLNSIHPLHTFCGALPQLLTYYVYVSVECRRCSVFSCHHLFLHSVLSFSLHRTISLASHHNTSHRSLRSFPFLSFSFLSVPFNSLFSSLVFSLALHFSTRRDPSCHALALTATATHQQRSSPRGPKIAQSLSASVPCPLAGPRLVCPSVSAAALFFVLDLDPSRRDTSNLASIETRRCLRFCVLLIKCPFIMFHLAKSLAFIEHKALCNIFEPCLTLNVPLYFD